MYHFLAQHSLVNDNNTFVCKGKEEVWEHYKNLMIEDYVFSFCYLEKYYEVFPNTMDEWIKSFETNPKKIGFDITIKDSVVDQIQNTPDYCYNKFHLKIIPQSHLFENKFFFDYLITPSCLTLVNETDRGVTATVIKDQRVITHSSELFKQIWKLLPEVKKTQ